MRALAVVVLLLASPVAADMSIVTDGVPARWLPCATALRAALRTRYPGSGDEHYCDLAATPGVVTFNCYGKCTDRSCHNDACVRHDDELDLTLEAITTAPTGWHRGMTKLGSLYWERQYAHARAKVVADRDLARLRRTIDACVPAGGGR